MPTYNRAGLISVAIQSVLCQTFTDWELIIVDDGSTDNTKDVVLSYECPQIKYIYQENQERSAARNNGIEHAKGVYICFLDSDDYYTPDRLYNLYQKVSKEHLGFYYTGFIVKANTSSRVIAIEPDASYTTHENILLATIHSQQTCISSEILCSYKFDKQFHIGEDTELWLRIADKFKPIFLADCTDIIVVDHDDRSVNLKSSNSAQEQLKTLKHIFTETHSLRKISERIRRDAISRCYFGIAKYYIYHKNTLKAIFYLLKSISEQPNSGQTKYKFNIIINLLFSPRKALELIAPID